MLTTREISSISIPSGCSLVGSERASWIEGESEWRKWRGGGARLGQASERLVGEPVCTDSAPGIPLSPWIRSKGCSIDAPRAWTPKLGRTCRSHTLASAVSLKTRQRCCVGNECSVQDFRK
eukprot:1362045-Rhodomonas_salina.2